MSTVVRRTFVSTPKREAQKTWEAIVDLLTKGLPESRRNELMAVAGIASSIIADRAPKDAPIIITCDGPRTRIYCLYDDCAIEGDEATEDALGFDPMAGDWAISLPCEQSDLSWVQKALKAHSTRITARDKAAAFAADDSSVAAKSGGLVLDVKGFLGQ